MARRKKTEAQCPRKAGLMLWMPGVSETWRLTLWVPFHGQWDLAKNTDFDPLLRKARRMAELLGIELEVVE